MPDSAVRVKRTIVTTLLMAVCVADAGAQDRWRTDTLTIRGTLATVAVSGYATPTTLRPDNLPPARVMAACDSIWLRFTRFPDLASSMMARPLGYRVDSIIYQSSGRMYHKDTYQTQYDIQFGRDGDLMNRLMSGREFGLNLRWRGGNPLQFVWSLKGSGAAIRKSCAQWNVARAVPGTPPRTEPE